MSDRTWMLIGALIGLLGLALGVGLVAGVQESDGGESC